MPSPLVPRGNHSPNNGVGQALRYQSESGGYFGKVFVSGPLVEHLIDPEKDVGIITFDEGGEICFKDAPTAENFRQTETIKDSKSPLELARIRGRICIDPVHRTLSIRR